MVLTRASQVCGQANCDWGKYGENCDKACPEHCIFNKDRNLQHCHKITGKCSEGCMHGWHGNQCDHPCSRHCLNSICNQQNGLCAFGCDGSYTGDFCNMTKSANEDREIVPTLTNADIKLSDDGNTSLIHLTCQPDDTSILENLLSQFDINRPGRRGWTPAMKAAVNGRKGKSGQTPLMRAVCGGHIAVYKYLVSSSADRTLVDRAGHTLLHLATRHGQLAVLKHIIHGFDVNTQDNKGLTPAMTAVLHGKAAVFKYLKDKGTDVSIVDNTGDYALALALKLRSRQIITQLARKHGRYNWTPVMMAAVCGHEDVFKLLVDDKADLSQVSATGEDILTLASRAKNTAIITY
ncbi:death-associated protein kinase 1-like [Haliotis rubra]|uniref:death-associated protein kinase 1-like n=1 Tax=Haliotis rubra TaxID=36100 RepID=UPI001EE5354F|nr:death-associated protein kinase 1-like [Haliotis rubra]